MNGTCHREKGSHDIPIPKLGSVPWKVDANLATVTKDLQPLAGQLHPHPVPPSLESYRAVLLDQAGVEPTEHSLSPVDARVVGNLSRLSPTMALSG